MCVSWLYFRHLTGNSLRILLCFRKFTTVLAMVVVFFSYLYCGFCSDFKMVSVPLGFEINGFERSKSWVSENGVFSFGFMGKLGEDGFVIGIKYNLGTNDAILPVWSVGNGLRVSENSTFKLSIDGKLVLIENPTGTVVWSSNTSGLGVEKASLLDNGNLVLMGNNNEIVWQSFNSPTHTLLPGQSLHYPQNLRAPSRKSISSYYNLVIRRYGELALVWEHNVTYWRSHFSSSDAIKEARFNSEGIFGIYDVSDKVVWSVSSRDLGDPSVTFRHLRINEDGNLRIYSWDNLNRSWKIGWQALNNQCDVFGSCGLYSYCGYNSTGPVCKCLYSDTYDDSGVSSCKKMVDLKNCMTRTSMLMKKQTVLYGLYPPHDVNLLLSELACKAYCSNDTTCIAATSKNDGSGLCTIKRTEYITGYSTPSIPSVSFLKVCLVPQAVSARHGGANPHGNTESLPVFSTNSRGSVKSIIGAIVLIVLVTVSAILTMEMVVFWVIYRRRRINAKTRVPFGKDTPHFSAVIRLSSEEIHELTNNFANRLGPSVFKGVLPNNNSPVVFKVLNNVTVSEKDFRITVSTLGGMHHRNLVPLKGFCYDTKSKVVLYDYVPNGSLEKWLFNPKQEQNSSVSVWQQRFNIGLGVARGIAYMHTECLQCITHGNLKLENVLLDENLVPKVSEYGLGKLLVKDTASSSCSPSEMDIYMLGELLLQIVTREREVVANNQQKIIEKLYEEQKSEGFDDFGAIERVVRIAFWCMQNQGHLRPDISEVVKVLEGTLSVDRPPSGFPIRQESTMEIELE